MERKLSLAAGGLLAGLFALNAQAADWSGPYAGISATWVDAEESLNSDEWSDVDAKSDGDGYALGGFWGYNLQKGNYVIGFETGLAWSNADSNIGDWDDGAVNTDIDYLVSLRSRLRYAFGDFLPYVAVGVGIAQTSTDIVCCTGDTDLTVDSADSTRTGLSYGIGVEWAFREQLRARLEYSRTEYSTEGFGSYDAFGDSVFGRLETDSIGISLGYAF